jgi:myo-inositol-1(or 4)-monophosphatase
MNSILMNQQDSKLAQLALDAISKAIDALRVSDAIDGHICFEKGRDIKLKADFLLNKELTDRLTNVTGIRCMSEEDNVSHGVPKGDAFWIVDPLDGSMNFSRGLPLYCVAVALWRDGKPNVGVVYDITRKRTFCACDGKAIVDNMPIRVRKVEHLEKAILATGFPVLTDFSDKALVWFTRFVKRFKKIRMLGTAALSLAWVAEGKLDAYFERDIMIWDVAAGLAIVEGAGGSYLMLPGRHPFSFDVLAGNHKLLMAMREEVKRIL